MVAAAAFRSFLATTSAVPARAALRPSSAAWRSPSLTARYSARAFSSASSLRAASSVSGKPGSASANEVKENAKEEVKKVTGDIAKAISGGNNPSPVSQVSGGSISELEQTVESLGGLAGNVPKQAMLFGGAGLLPYIGTSMSSIYLARQVNLAETAGSNSTIDLDTSLALLHHVGQIQLSYGAVILSFLGAIHWGFEFAKFGGQQGTPRYMMGIVPVMLAWPSLLFPTPIGLATQWAAFASVWYIDSRATANGWTPKWYSTYRFGLTAVVGSCILLTLGVSNYYSSGSISGAAKKLQQIKRAPQVTVEQTETEGPAGPKIAGTVTGDFETKEGGEAYVKFENVEKRKEEEAKKAAEEAEEKKKKDLEEAEKKKQEATDAAREKRDKAEGRA